MKLSPSSSVADAMQRRTDHFVRKFRIGGGRKVPISQTRLSHERCLQVSFRQISVSGRNTIFDGFAISLSVDGTVSSQSIVLRSDGDGRLLPDYVTGVTGGKTCLTARVHTSQEVELLLHGSLRPMAACQLPASKDFTKCASIVIPHSDMRFTADCSYTEFPSFIYLPGSESPVRCSFLISASFAKREHNGSFGLQSPCIPLDGGRYLKLHVFESFKLPFALKRQNTSRGIKNAFNQNLSLSLKNLSSYLHPMHSSVSLLGSESSNPDYYYPTVELPVIFVSSPMDEVVLFLLETVDGSEVNVVAYASIPFYDERFMGGTAKVILENHITTKNVMEGRGETEIFVNATLLA